MYGEGISREGDILDLAVETQIVEKSGAWFSFEGDRIGQGRENSKTFLKEHLENQSGKSSTRSWTTLGSSRKKLKEKEKEKEKETKRKKKISNPAVL